MRVAPFYLAEQMGLAVGSGQRNSSCREVQDWLRDETILNAWFLEAEKNPHKMLARIAAQEFRGRLDGELIAEVASYCNDLIRIEMMRKAKAAA